MRKIILLLAFLIPVCSLHAQESGVFLKLPMSPRGAAMGDAFTALANEPLGIYYNPAGIAFVKYPEVSLAYQIYLQNINGDSAGFVLPFGNFAIGFAPTIFKMKEEILYDSFGNDTGQSFGYQTIIAPLAVAGRFGDLAVGVAAKYYSEKIGDQSSQTNMFDAGAIYNFNKLRFGFSSQNYGGRIFGYDVAKIQRLGLAYAGNGFVVAADGVKEGSAGNYLNAGGAFSVLDLIRLRAGWRLGKALGGPTFGVGFNLGNFSIDYAFVGYGDLGDTHTMGLSYSFGVVEEKIAPPAPIAAPNHAPQLLWTGEENYTSVGLSTSIGNTSMSFGYRVKYTDADNDAPASGDPKVHIKKGGVELLSSPFAMEYISGDNRTGAIYAHAQRLPAGNDYSYYFDAKDRLATDASGAPTVQAEGPMVFQVEAGKIPGGINVAVAEFTGKNVSPADASIVADFLRTELVNTGLFNVMDRNNMDSVLAEQKFQNSGCTEQQCAAEMGKLLNVKKMLVGSLSKLLDTYYITVNVVDVETGKITASYDSDAATSRELKDACRKIAEKLSQN